jgi:heme/copper-type cytochrome/quinol oxidase subunit 2
MDKNEKRKRVIEIAVGVLILIIVAVLVGYALSRNGAVGSRSSQTGASGAPNALLGPQDALAPSGVSTVAPVPAGTSVPNAGAVNTPSNVAIPAVQSAGDPSGNVSYRSFNIKIDGGAFSPNTVIVKQGDTVNLELTAVDASYGFTLPSYKLNAPIAEGKTQTIQFQALQIGDFTFYCGSCGDPSTGPIGHFIVTAN